MAQPEAKSSDPQAVRIARLMGLPDADAMTDAGLARVVGVGVPVATTVVKAKPLPRGKVMHFDVAQATSVKTKAKASQTLSREDSERLYELSRVMDTALRAFGDDRAKAEAFLGRPHPLLDGEIPLELAQVSSAGADAVVALIGRATAGVAI